MIKLHELFETVLNMERVILSVYVIEEGKSFMISGTREDVERLLKPSILLGDITLIQDKESLQIRCEVNHI